VDPEGDQAVREGDSVTLVSAISGG
jgi:sulfur carrier protein ThiS